MTLQIDLQKLCVEVYGSATPQCIFRIISEGVAVIASGYLKHRSNCVRLRPTEIFRKWLEKQLGEKPREEIVKLLAKVSGRKCEDVEKHLNNGRHWKIRVIPNGVQLTIISSILKKLVDYGLAKFDRVANGNLFFVCRDSPLYDILNDAQKVYEVLVELCGE